MANGKETTRDIVIRIDERVKAIQCELTAHKKNHKWIVGIIIGLVVAIPGSLYYLSQLKG